MLQQKQPEPPFSRYLTLSVDFVFLLKNGLIRKISLILKCMMSLLKCKQPVHDKETLDSADTLLHILIQSHTVISDILD